MEALEKKNKLIFILRQDRVNNAILENKAFDDRFLIFKDCHNILPKHELKPFFDSLKLSDDLLPLYDEFINNNFKNKKVIGIHVRYYHSGLPLCNHTPYWENLCTSFIKIKEKINEAINKVKGNDFVLFLSTDSTSVNEFIKGEYHNVLTYPKEFGTFETLELHVEHATQSAIPTVLEMFLLSRSDILVRYPPSKSWFSYYASIYSKEEII